MTASRRQAWYRVTYQHARHEPRTAPEVICEECYEFLSLHGWAVESEHLTQPADWPSQCAICHVGRRGA